MYYRFIIVSAYKYLVVKMSVRGGTFISAYENANVFLLVYKKLLIKTHP